ncbi:uncharacterized protein PHACADRAFT_192867 [Phanerochaete carnosa HHB-10118-sp]|uniref:Uncharacterized protein n=1 Tax=Phanerochaete carnosa (strain HHB-10118-sp) TaxID=650164 RepID=K5V520_PHACS|nr:uncharacterized protein PHACADRAFT_192867 [Phanerochaete carnosa HHB-10118-sp]EKM57731.1 hypothetical protein PHACADRAFT_192867 [Phanerochaete carnosa HHB-10118-sp]
MPHGPPYLREASSSLLHNRRQRDKALLVGLEYGRKGDDAVPPLPGIHEDIHCFREYLIKHELYWPNNITVLLDDGMDDTQGIKSVADDSDLYRLNKPNRKTILREFRRLVEGMREGDCRILLSKSCHGAQLINLDGTEEDERDEGVSSHRIRFNERLTTSCSLHCSWERWFPPFTGDAPLLESPEDIGRLPENHDFYKVLKGLILDNEFRKELVDAIPPGSQLVAIVETCHSGTLLDLDSMKPEEVHVDDEVHGCGNPAKGKTLHLGLSSQYSSPLEISPRF